MQTKRAALLCNFYLPPVLGSVAVSAVSADVLPYISVAIKASFLKLGMCNICKNNIAKMFLDFLNILNCSFDRRFLNFW